MGKLQPGAPFGVGATGVPSFECLRLLCGSVILEHKDTLARVPLKFCNLAQSTRVMKSNTIKEIVNRAFDDEIGIDEVRVFLEVAQHRNLDYWERLKGELCLALHAAEQQRHVEAFLHTYRLFEWISIAMPLFFAQGELDYFRSMDFLKALPENDKSGELLILKRFSAKVSEAGGYGGLTIDVPLTCHVPGWDQEFADQIDKFVLEPEGIKDADVDIAQGLVKIPFSSFPKFYVAFRNRLFHNSISRKNLIVDKLGGAELTCRPLTRPALNWFCLVFCVVLNRAVSRVN
jgi:hypothetical protein